MNQRFTISLAAIVLLLFGQCHLSKNNSSYPYQFQKSATADRAMVISAHPLASEIGLKIMQKGGNAVDASVAVHLALAVVYPQAGNIGGGGFFVYRGKNGETATLDFREKAPALASKNMYLDCTKRDSPVIKNLSTLGFLAAGVPGTIDGLVQQHAAYGHLAWRELVEPARLLAKNGFKITQQEADNLNHIKPILAEANRGRDLPFVKNTAWLPGDLLVQSALAATLERVRDRGRAGFYSGETAEIIAREMREMGGIISEKDLANYHAIWRNPVIFNYKDLNIISMPPPSSGGIALAQLMKFVEPYDLKKMGFQSAETVHLMVEAERRVYADRSVHLGDPDFWAVPTEKLLNEKYLENRMSDFSAKKATPSSAIAAGNFSTKKDHEQTTHFSIVDPEGTAVSVTTTLNDSYGSHAVVAGAGFILNNEMDDFSVKPGVSNIYGLVGGAANAIEPGKRMLSSMTPAIVERGGKLWMVVGTPGGSTIITSVFQTILNVREWEKSPADAVAAPRFHSQWLPDLIFVEENAVEETVRETLRGMGHKIEKRGPMGRVECILVRGDGRLEGGADVRGDDHAVGF